MDIKAIKRPEPAGGFAYQFTIQTLNGPRPCILTEDELQELVNDLTEASNRANGAQ